MKNIGTIQLETDRLILRRLTVNDATKAYENWCSSFEVSKYVTWYVHKNVEETKKLFSIWEKDYEDDDTYRWIVELKENHEVIGIIDVVSKSIKYSACEIGYCYGDKFWGMGYASEALNAVIKFLFEVCDAEVVFAEHASDNPNSGKVMKKCGMIFEGVLRNRFLSKDNVRNDLISYSILKSEYFENKKM